MSTWGRCFYFLLLILTAASSSARASIIQSVSITKNAFNPTAGESVRLNFIVQREGQITIHVVDRDGFLVRTLVSQRLLASGKQAFDWDGRDDRREVVADEAYSFRIVWKAHGLSETFFPADSVPKEVPVKIGYYDRKRAIVSYYLPTAARVHLQGAVARINSRTKEPEGPVLKTIVNRAPRAAGNVVEFWNGFNDNDESIYLPDQPNFKMAVAATELPACSVVAMGNQQASFLETALNREGKSFFTFKSAPHIHHSGLTALQDQSPLLKVKLVNGKRLADTPIWLIHHADLEIEGEIHGPSAAAFAQEPGRLWIFIDEKRISDLPRPEKNFRLKLPLEENHIGEHILTLNWISEYGPVAVNALRFHASRKKP